MIRRFSTLFAVALAAAISAFPAPAADDNLSVVALLYELHGDNGPPLWQAPEHRQRLFTPALLAAFDAAAAQSAAHPDEAPALNGDPFYDAQDWAEVKPCIGAPEPLGGDAASVTVRLSVFGEPRVLRYALVRTEDGWRIDDIDYGDGVRLRDLLSGG